MLLCWCTRLKVRNNNPGKGFQVLFALLKQADPTQGGLKVSNGHTDMTPIIIPKVLGHLQCNRNLKVCQHYICPHIYLGLVCD